MTYEEVLSFLSERLTFGIKPGLERVNALLDAVGHPERDYKTIHVTGTNGKGSVTAYIASVCYQSGCKVGRYTSPHLMDYTERIRINDVDISQEDFGIYIGKIAETAPRNAEGQIEATEFDILTAAAFLYFKDQGVDYAVIEVGMGGLLDSTNIITPLVSVITNVTLDHTKYCGNTVQEIAQQKAGIIKSSVPVVTAAQVPALAVIEKTAKKKKAPLYVFDKDFSIASRFASTMGQMITFKEEGKPDAMLFTRLQGRHQAVNLACAAKACRLLMQSDSRISEETMREGLAMTAWPGRFEIIKIDGRTIVLDGAHNAAGAEAFHMTYEEVFKDRPKQLVMAILADKDISSIVAQVVLPKDNVITVPAPTPRTMNPEKLAHMMPVEAEAASSVAAGMDKAWQTMDKETVLVVCGSLYILGQVKAWLAEKQAN